MPTNTLTYTRRHTFSAVLTCTMSPKRTMVSPMRSAAIWRLSTFRCRNSKERSVDLISQEIKYFCVACLGQQCRSIKCIRCKPVMAMMTGLTPFDANYRIGYTSGQTSTTGRKRSMETYLRIDLEEIIEYASTLVTLRKCTLGNKREKKTLKFVLASTKGFKGGLAWIKPSKKDMAVTFSYCCLLANQDIPPSCSFKQLRSWTFFR